MAKKPENSTYLYEAVVHLEGFEKAIHVILDDHEWERIVNILESEDAPRFYDFNPAEGREIFINLDFVPKINLLENLPGILFKKEPKKSDEEEERLFHEREDSDVRVVFRLWFADSKSQEVFSEIPYEDWIGIRMDLEENRTKFIGFIDEDGERVMFNISNLAAIEVFDEHYISWEEIEKILNGERNASPSLPV